MLISRTDSHIASEVAWRITWMAEVGDLVEAGDVLAKLDDQILQLNYAQNTENIATWIARVNLLERKQKRFTAMTAQQSSSKDQLDEFLSDLEIARQELAQAQISRKSTVHQISRSEVKAPFKSLVAQKR